MAFIFTMRSTPSSSMHRTDPSSQGSIKLPPIDEDGAVFATPVPQRAYNRPADRVFGLGAPPVLNFEGSPPEYSQFDSNGVEGPRGEKLSDVRKGIHDNKHIAKRGGWKRLAIIALIIILCIVGLVVGLVVGLRNRHSNSSAGSSSSPGGASGSIGGNSPNPATNTTFPAGSYSIETVLSSVSTNCTSNPATWTCYPYTTYGTSPSTSAATFDWIIIPVNDASSPNYTISSTQNPFSFLFTNTSMSLMNPGTAQEHYFFQLNMNKPTNPATALTNANIASTCYFNDTAFQAYLYTKMEKSYPDYSTDGMEGTNTKQAFAPWPFAVRVEQVANAGPGTLTCVDDAGDSMGDFSVADGAESCQCLYLNTGT